jgi:hypothetical protein
MTDAVMGDLGKVGAKFWGESKRCGTQTLTLKLRPRLEATVTTEQGQSVTRSRGVDVEGQLAAGQQLRFPRFLGGSRSWSDWPRRS